MPQVDTLGAALSYGWRITAACAFGSKDAMKTIRECHYRDLETLVWTRGRTFPLSTLESRLKCPQCSSRRVRLIDDVPTDADRKRAVR